MEAVELIKIVAVGIVAFVLLAIAYAWGKKSRKK